jgi:hypothetical protein
VNSTLRLRTRTTSRSLKRHALALLGPPINVEVVPHLRHLRAAIIQRSLARGSLVVPRARASHIRRGAVLGTESLLKVGESVGSGVRGDDVVVGEPLEGVQAAVVHDDGFEKVNHFFVFDVLRAVAGDVEGGKAGGVLGELVLGKC